MKHFFIFGFLLLTLSASAQRANFKSAYAKHEAGVYTQFNCTLTELTNPEQAQLIAEIMKTTPGILKLDVLNPAAKTAELRIVTVRENSNAVLQKALTAAKVNTITLDEKRYKTAHLNKAININ